MPFQYILANLLAENDRAVGVLFMDGTGETVDVVCSGYTPEQLKVVGAYLGIYFRQLDRAMESAELGGPRMIHIEVGELHILATALPDEYYLVLVQKRPAVVARSRVSLLEAATELGHELFVD